MKRRRKKESDENSAAWDFLCVLLGSVAVGLTAFLGYRVINLF
jgi:hypothetical protein